MELRIKIVADTHDGELIEATNKIPLYMVDKLRPLIRAIISKKAHNWDKYKYNTGELAEHYNVDEETAVAFDEFVPNGNYEDEVLTIESVEITKVEILERYVRK